MSQNPPPTVPGRRPQLDIFANVRDLGEPELFDFLNQLLWIAPEELRFRLKEVLDTLPPEGDNLERVFGLIRAQWKDLRSHDSIQIAIVGPSRTGKSSLAELLKARASRPAEMFSIVDTQGLDEFLGFGRDSRTPPELESADIVLLLLDARYGLTDDTRQLVDRLRELPGTLLVALNKIDAIEDASRRVRQARRRLKAPVLPLSTRRPETLDPILKAFVTTSSKALYPLARNFPHFRRSLCSGTVTQAGLGAALVGAIPLPVSDLLPLTAIQVSMVLKLARVYGFEMDRTRARELIPMLMAGTLIREATHRLQERCPGQSTLIAVSAAGSWTFLLGQLGIRYFENLVRMSNRPALRLVESA